MTQEKTAIEGNRQLEQAIKTAILKTLVVSNKESIEKFAVPEIIKAYNQNKVKT